MARSALMCEILATMLNRPLHLLKSDEGPALRAAVTALAALENHVRKRRGEEAPYTVADAVGQMVKFRPQPAKPNASWRAAYEKVLRNFEKTMRR